MYNDTIKLLNLERFNLNIKKLDISKVNNTIYCYITLEPNTYNCPICKSNIFVMKDYQSKKITHSISTNNPCFIIYYARRYKCKICNSTFYEFNPFTNSYSKVSTYTILMVLNSLKDHTATFNSVSSIFNLSKTTIIDIFDSYVEPRRRTLPEVIL